MAAGRKPLSRFPCINCRKRHSQILGDFLQRGVVFLAPHAKCGREAGTDVAVKTGLFGHGESLHEPCVASNGLNPAHSRRVIVVDARTVLGIALQSSDDVRSGTNLNIRILSDGYRVTASMSSARITADQF
jgi:hypothetical protein